MTTNYQKITDRFLVAYVKNQTSVMEELLAENCKMHFSNLGDVYGKSDILRSLSWEETFDVRTVTATNYLEYTKDGFGYVTLMAHHLVAYEDISELFPFCFGGKYVFLIDPDNKIQEISFVLEYQTENTALVKGKWKLSNGLNQYDTLSCFDFSLMQQVIAKEPKADRLSDYTKLFFYCMDTGNQNVLTALIDPSLHILRPKTMGGGIIEGTAETFGTFLDESRSYYHFDQYSIAVDHQEEKDGKTVLYAQHLTPQRLGTKKLNPANKYHSFFDEDIEITFSEAERIQDITFSKVTDIHYNGFDILHF
jgi:hypothetical protein